jgi:hypothetical protein
MQMCGINDLSKQDLSSQIINHQPLFNESDFLPYLLLHEDPTC